MQALLEHFITQSTVYSLMAVVLVAFLESLALVGLILPGTVLMAGLGALIGSGELSFWHAWLAGIVGCLLGDWISAIGVVALVVLIRHPLMPVYIDILRKVVGG